MEKTDNIFDEDSWLLFVLFLSLLDKNNSNKEQPIINIYLGDE